MFYEMTNYIDNIKVRIYIKKMSSNIHRADVV